MTHPTALNLALEALDLAAEIGGEIDRKVFVEAKQKLQGLIDVVAAFDSKMNSEERVPEGDDYNQLVSVLEIQHCAVTNDSAKGKKAKAGKRKIPHLNWCLSGRSMSAAFAAAEKRWPGVKLGYVGTDPETFRHYFQEFANPKPFILG
ncbi:MULTISPECIES: hypothetical protein [Pseudomonas]|uniref:Uncharacterized protein n=1 Tax=Pseudomonas fluorescens TaxID=294 RepID=A0A161ZFB7_PSEFL|nr:MULTISPECIES: hypothetical protein [Pseudomonas]KZN20572.1 hypothetical protein A1D17_03270 [Pseudomonas fluorescens]